MMAPANTATLQKVREVGGDNFSYAKQQLAKEADMNEYCLKLIIEHDVNDVTERVYTHRTLENLRTEIEKIK